MLSTLELISDPFVSVKNAYFNIITTKQEKYSKQTKRRLYFLRLEERSRVHVAHKLRVEDAGLVPGEDVVEVVGHLGEGDGGHSG